MPGLIIDRARRCVYREEREIRLSPQMYRVLLYLAQRSEEVVSKEDLMEAMWPEIDNENAWTCRGDPSAIDLVIFRLRQKLDDSAADPTYLETLRGFGYILHHARIVEPKAREEGKDASRQARAPASADSHSPDGPRFPWAKLTRREWEIFLLLGDEEATRLTNQALAQQVGIAESTLKKHLQNIYRKLRVENRSGAALLAMQARILLRRDDQA